MATQTATPPVAPSAEVVGNAFVEQYYHILHHSPEIVYKFYQDSSVLSRPDHNGVITSVTTMQSINDKICSLDYKNCRAEIKTADAQESYNGGVIVLVTGSLTGRDNQRRIFTQTFFLAPQEKGYFVLNDVFRFVEVCEPGENAGTITGIGDASTHPMEDQEPAHVITPKKWDQAISLEEGAQNGKENAHDLLEEESQVNNNEEIMVEADSCFNDQHFSVDLESRIGAPEDTLKKSYASIVSSETRKGPTKVYSETRKGPTKVYVPAGSSKAAPIKTEKWVVDSAAQSTAQAPESLPPTATSSVTISESKDAEDEVEGYSIYIGNLPRSITVDQLETEFTRFGPIKPNGIQVRNNRQQGFCFGFVEFQDLSSMQSAIQASPITIGSHEAVIEVKRTTRRVDSGRYRFSTGRGVVRSDSFRGRGNFRGGRGYVRSDFGSRMDFSGHGRSLVGEGYQQGRGRGGRRGDQHSNAVSM